MSLGNTMTVALNFWDIAPEDKTEDIYCFQDVGHKFYDVTDPLL